MNEVDYSVVIADLKLRRNKLKEEYEAQLMEISAAIKAMERLIPSSQAKLFLDVVPRAGSGLGTAERVEDYLGKSIPQAAELYLKRVKEPKTTPELVEALAKRSIRSNAKNPTNSVYTSLNGNDMFWRRNGKWGLTEWDSE